jgi:hypothetical protein
MSNDEIRQITRRIADTGLTNMFDQRVVIQIAEAMGYIEYAEWARHNRSAYGRLILTGRLPGDEEGNEAE